MENLLEIISSIDPQNVKSPYLGEFEYEGETIRYNISFGESGDSTKTSSKCIPRLTHFYKQFDDLLTRSFVAITSNEQAFDQYYQMFIKNESSWLDAKTLKKVFGHSKRDEISKAEFHNGMELESASISFAGTDREYGVFDYVIGGLEIDDWMTVGIDTTSLKVSSVSFNNQIETEPLESED